MTGTTTTASGGASGFDQGCRSIIGAFGSAVGTIERDRARTCAALDRLVASGNPNSEELAALSKYVDETMRDVKNKLDAAAAAIGVLPAILGRSQRVLDATAQRIEKLLSTVPRG